MSERDKDRATSTPRRRRSRRWWACFVLCLLIAAVPEFLIGRHLNIGYTPFDSHEPRAYRVGECLAFHSLTGEEGMHRVACSDDRAFYRVAVIRDINSPDGCPPGEYAPTTDARFHHRLCMTLAVAVGRCITYPVPRGPVACGGQVRQSRITAVIQADNNAAHCPDPGGAGFYAVAYSQPEMEVCMEPDFPRRSATIEPASTTSPTPA